jgi:hypothetical protein
MKERNLKHYRCTIITNRSIIPKIQNVPRSEVNQQPLGHRLIDYRVEPSMICVSRNSFTLYTAQYGDLELADISQPSLCVGTNVSSYIARREEIKEQWKN